MITVTYNSDVKYIIRNRINDNINVQNQNSSNWVVTQFQFP